jgi:APA family basic amino acid/polyamine antiporter
MPWVGLGGLLVCIYLMSVLPFATWRRLLVWLAVGLAIYFLYGRRNVERARSAATVTGGGARALA